MIELREFFEEAAGAPPPSRLVAGEVYAAGRRRRRLRTVAAAATAAVVAGVLLVGGGLLLTGRSGDALPPADDPTPAPPAADRPIRWSGAADATHLYLSVMACTEPSQSCPKTVVQLRGSDDGGHTWSDRGEPLNAARLAVAGPSWLVASVFTGGTEELRHSTNGGRTWAPVGNAPAVDTSPMGTTVVCWTPGGEACTLHALDPAGRGLAPLRRQPALHMSAGDLVPPRSGGRIWVPGLDPATGRPAVAVSPDAGRSWSVQVLMDAPACAPAGCLPAYLAVGAGPVAYAVAVGAKELTAYRYREGDGWARIGTVPTERPSAGGASYVAADGTHVLCQTVPQRDDRDGCRFWANRGGTYRQVDLMGLPSTMYPIHRAADGWLYTHSNTDDRLYGSADGWTWSALPSR